jgi:hypothetical protein
MKENYLYGPEKRWKEELDGEIELEGMHKYLKKAKNGKAVGIDGYPKEFWKELCRKENMIKILVELMKTFMKQEIFHQVGRLVCYI